MSLTYSLRDEGQSPVTGDTEPGPAMRAYRDDEATGLLLRLIYTRTVGITAFSDIAPEALDLALRAWVIGRFERRVREPDLAEEVDLTTIDTSDAEVVAEIRRLASAPKACEWLIEHGRDLYCGAASVKDETATQEIEGRVSAPTSPTLCAGCAVPDGRTLCSMFMHAEVLGSRAMGGHRSRNFAGALCRVGRAEINTQPSGCQSGGNDCWRRVVTVESESHERNLGPNAIPEALDHLDAIWRLRNGTKRRLLRLRSATDTAGLTQGCADRGGFENRILDLSDVLDQFEVSDDLLGESPPAGSLMRLSAWAEGALDDEQASEAVAAISDLRRVRQIRTAFAHSAAGDQLPESLAALGITYPPEWTTAWEAVRARTVDALDRLRRSIDDR